MGFGGLEFGIAGGGGDDAGAGGVGYLEGEDGDAAGALDDNRLAR